MACSLRDRLCSQKPQLPVLLDGGTGSLLLGQLRADELQAGETTAVLNLNSPDIVLAAHLEFLQAGAEILLTNSFGASRAHLRDRASESQFEQMNREAVRIATEALSRFGRDERWIAGSIGPLSPDFSMLDQQEIFYRQATVLLTSGVNMLVCETFMEIAQVELAVTGCRRAMSESGIEIPLVVSLVPSAQGINERDLELLGILRQSGKIDMIGLNCGSGIEATKPWLDVLYRMNLGPFWLKPSGGLPIVLDGTARYNVEARLFADGMADVMKDLPIAAAGGCCGITPECIGALKLRMEHNHFQEKAKA